MLSIWVTMAVFAVLHSLLAGQQVKGWLRRRVGERAYHGCYRLAYNVFAIVTLAPPALLLLSSPGATLWRVEAPARYLLFGLQALGLVGILVSLLQIDYWRFAGLHQLHAYITGLPLPLPDEPLQTRGVYRLVRHPLYLFSLLVIWPMSSMSESLLAFNSAATLYFVVGSLVEERRLLATFGATYRHYQTQVPWLIPFVRLRRLF